LLFERNDFDELLRPALAKKGSASAPSPRIAPPAPSPFELTDQPLPVQPKAPAVAVPIIAPPTTPAKPRRGIFLSPLLIALILGFIFVSVSAAFVIGLIVGRMIAH